MSRTRHLFHCTVLLQARLGTFITHRLRDEYNIRPLFVCACRCPDSARPETIRPCVLPCVKDCIVTPFSEWTACPSTCMPGSLEHTLLNLFQNCNVVFARCQVESLKFCCSFDPTTVFSLFCFFFFDVRYLQRVGRRTHVHIVNWHFNDLNFRVVFIVDVAVILTDIQFISHFHSYLEKA